MFGDISLIRKGYSISPKSFMKQKLCLSRSNSFALVDTSKLQDCLELIEVQDWFQEDKSRPYKRLDPQFECMFLFTNSQDNIKL